MTWAAEMATTATALSRSPLNACPRQTADSGDYFGPLQSLGLARRARRSLNTAVRLLLDEASLCQRRRPDYSVHPSRAISCAFVVDNRSCNALSFNCVTNLLCYDTYVAVAPESARGDHMREAIALRKKFTAGDLRRMAETAKEPERERNLADRWEDEANRTETTECSKDR
jgi:hypothetical protein